MEETLIRLYEIAKGDGVYGVLVILTGALWWKLDKKDTMVYELMGILKENTINQQQIIERLKEVNENIIKTLTKK